ncbi:GntR family transcriptional regulator [Promicromonospora vindobonensis]|uniref:GntR family transcriptional regulator n=1 Tax=Promicromonospora vindobonensis TaxID=195748 RepID=A0ABW5VRS4_9MICO
MADGGSRAKKYHQIADAIRAQIRAGDLPVGSRLPAETAIAADHNTSVPTVRQAMGVLRAEGLIESRHGVGTFVRETQRFERRSRHRYGAARARAGLMNNTFRHDIVGAGPEPAPERIASAMGIAAGTEVIVRRRDLYDDKNELQEIGASYLPADFAAGTYLAVPKVVPKALFRCVEEITGRRYAYALDHWIARPAAVEEAEAFGLPLGAYVVHIVHTATDENGDALEVSESIWPADRLAFIDEYDIPAEADPDALKSDI